MFRRSNPHLQNVPLVTRAHGHYRRPHRRLAHWPHRCVRGWTLAIPCATEPSSTATGFLRRMRPHLRTRIADGTGVHAYAVDQAAPEDDCPRAKAWPSSHRPTCSNRGKAPRLVDHTDGGRPSHWLSKGSPVSCVRSKNEALANPGSHKSPLVRDIEHGATGFAVYGISVVALQPARRAGKPHLMRLKQRP